MALVTWLRAFDALAELVDATRRRRAEAAQSADLASAAGLPGTGQLEARLAGVVVAALKEAFDRDRTRLELEAAQVEAERRRAEDLLELELRRQVGDRAFAQLRLLLIAALGIWLASALLSVLVPGMREDVSKVLMAVGWVALFGSLACGLAGYRSLSRWMAHEMRGGDLPAGPALTLTSWLLLSGLVLTAGSLLWGL